MLRLPLQERITQFAAFGDADQHVLMLTESMHLWFYPDFKLADLVRSPFMAISLPWTVNGIAVGDFDGDAQVQGPCMLRDIVYVRLSHVI